jgi:hypothetical protein
MPTLTQESVGVLPMLSRTASTLTEIRDAMITTPPNHQALTGGWASMKNKASNLGIPGGNPPASDPVIVPAAGSIPETLRARFYFWAPPPTGAAEMPGYDPHTFRRLQALDVLIHAVDDDHIGIVVSSRSRTILGRRDGAIAALQKILRAKDATIRIDRNASPLALADADIFLWLTVQRRDQPQLDPDLHLDLVSGMRSVDTASRTADLRVDVGFDRPNFLTAVAELDQLGPIEISFVETVGTERQSFVVEVFLDGGFTIRRNNLHFTAVVDAEQMMLDAALGLTYGLIPRINRLYKANKQHWDVRRREVILDAMQELEDRYKGLREALEARLQAGPGEDDQKTD